MAGSLGNKNAVGNNGGQPPLYENAIDLQTDIENYFIYIQGESKKETQMITSKDGSIQEVEVDVWIRRPEPETVTGLALFLGFESRQSLYDYQKKIEYSYLIKRARLRIENAYEKNLHYDKNTGSIFALKNMGWIDKSEIDAKIENKEIIEIGGKQFKI